MPRGQRGAGEVARGRADTLKTRVPKRSHAPGRPFFFSSRGRHTRSLRDWSSDVCSSDYAFGDRHEQVERKLTGARGCLERLQRLEEAAGTSEFSFDLLVAVAEGMRRGAEPYLPVERRRALGSGDKHIASARPKAVEELRATTLVGLEFAYRDISDADLDAYLAFLSSPDGRALTADVHQALLHAVRTSTEDAIVAIAQVIPPLRWGENRQREAPAPKPSRL